MKDSQVSNEILKEFVLLEINNKPIVIRSTSNISFYGTTIYITGYLQLSKDNKEKTFIYNRSDLIDCFYSLNDCINFYKRYKLLKCLK